MIKPKTYYYEKTFTFKENDYRCSSCRLNYGWMGTSITL